MWTKACLPANLHQSRRKKEMRHARSSQNFAVIVEAFEKLLMHKQHWLFCKFARLDFICHSVAATLATWESFQQGSE